MGPSGNTWVTTIFPFPFKQMVNGTLADQDSYTQEIHLKVSTCVCVCVKTKKTIQYNQAFRYFGWLAMTPMLVLNCLLCCTAFQMGEHNFMEDTYARILIKISLTQKGRVQL